MRAVIQRVSKASVSVEKVVSGSIGKGFLVLLGVEEADDSNDAQWLAQKILSLRIFSDDEGKMNHDLQTVSGDVLAVSQFTLHAKTKKGTRPSFIRAAHPEKAEMLYEEFCSFITKESNRECQKGVFGADMEIELINDGPVTIIIDTQKKE